MTRIVPEKPTQAMLDAMAGAVDEYLRADNTQLERMLMGSAYTAMIQAAPDMGGQISSISTGMAIEAQARKALLEELIDRAESETTSPDFDDRARPTASWLRSVLEEE